jgi:hypothetical protein
MTTVAPPRSADACSSFVKYDVTAWPLVVVTVVPGTPSDDVFDAHLVCFDELLKRDQPFCILFDVRRASLVPFRMLKRQSRQMRTLEPEICRSLVCSAIVVDNALVQALITAMFAIKPPSRPNARFKTVEEAKHWMLQYWDAPTAAVESPELPS